jgi:hypothetical protein
MAPSIGPAVYCDSSGRMIADPPANLLPPI